jgi:serine/threonine protein kinase
LICLDENSALDFLSGRLASLALADAERHLGECGSCIELLARSTPFLAGKEGTKASQSDSQRASTLSTFVLSAPDNQAGNRQAPAVPAPSPVPLSGSGTAAVMNLAAAVDSPEGAVTLAPGTVLKDTYRILGLIGRGGMGEVYEVKHARLAGRYALKLLPPAFAIRHISLTRFRREADITSALRHPNIVQVIDFDDTPAGQPFLVMEYLDGGDLGQLMATTGPMPLPRVLSIVGQIVSALSAVHRNGIVHRDLKPQNVLLVRHDDSAQDRVKLVDFGLSKRTDGEFLDLGSNISRERTLLGTPRYMAPEQAAGKVDEIDATTDQFALGAIVYEMLTGTFAFNDDHMAVLLYKISSQEPLPMRSFVPDIPEHVELAVRRAMSKRKVDRFPNTNDFLDTLCGAPKPSASPAENIKASAANIAGIPHLRSPWPSPWSPSAGRAASPSGADVPPTAMAVRIRRVVSLAIGVGVAVGLGFAIGGWNSKPVPTRDSYRAPLSASLSQRTVPVAERSDSPIPVDNPRAEALPVLGSSRGTGQGETVGNRLERGPSGRPVSVSARSRRGPIRPVTAVGPASPAAAPADLKKSSARAPVGRLVEDL